MMNSSVFISFFFSTRRMLKSSWFDRDICLFKEYTSLCSSHPFLCLCSGDPQQITMCDDASDHDATEAATAKKPSLICKKKKCKSGTTVSRCSVKNCTKCSCEGLKEDEDKWEATIRRRCPHFYDLLPIMGERASASPVIDSEKGIDATDDSSDSLSDSASQSTYVPKDPPIAGKKLAKDVLQVGDIITYMATTTDQEGYIQTKKKTTQN